MATIKVKLRQSSVAGRAGTIFYQLTHRKSIRQIATEIRLHPYEWDPIREVVTTNTINREIIQNRIDCDIVLFKRIIDNLDKTKNSYSVNDIVFRYKTPKHNGTQAIANAVQKTSNALSKAIKKNSAKLKYGTQVYLINGKEKRN